MGNNFYIKRDIQNITKIGKYLENLPEFCRNYMLDIESYTSSLTRLGYITDLSIFFEFISKYKFRKDMKLITYSDIEKITLSDLTSYLSYISYYTKDGKNYKNSEKGKARKLASIRSFFKNLYQKDLISSDIASKITMPKIHQKEIIRLEPDEVAKMLNSIENPTTQNKTKNQNKLRFRDLAMLSLFLSTGIRLSECVGLNVEDFDFDNNAFKITRKGGNQTVLYFPEEIKEALQKWLETREIMGPEKKENAFFISLRLTRISNREVQKLVHKYSSQINPLKSISPHKLRSTFGTNLYRETGDIYMVADFLGHKDINTTKKHYAAISEDMRRNVANIVKLRK